MKNLAFGEYTLDTIHRQVRKEHLVLPIQGKAFDLLQYMASNAGRPLLKDELLQAVWPDSFVEEANLAQNVSVLRRILGTGQNGPIVTLPGRGYQFAASVREVVPTRGEDAPASPSQTHATLAMPTFVEATRTRLVLEEEVTAPTRYPTWLVLASILAFCALTVGSVLGWRYWQNHSGGAPVQVVLATTDGTTGDPILDVALADALRMDLAQSPFVTVLPSSRVRSTLTLMKLPTATQVKPEIAREICERTDSQAVLHGNIARMGEHFLLTEEATSCVDGTDLGEAKQEASRAEDLPSSIDKLAAGLRRTLGESRRSVARFDKPLFRQSTASLEALKDFSQAVHDFELGRFSEAIQMNDRAIVADPDFAAAYYNRSAYDSTVGDDAGSRAAIFKAYSFRDSVNEPLRLAISTTYNMVIAQDLFETERICRNWIELYPRSLNAWNLFSNTELALGKIPEATSYAGVALRNWPENQTDASNYGTAQLHNGDFAGARATFEKALAVAADSDYIRSNYLELTYTLHDDALLREQLAWAERHPAGWSLGNAAHIAVAEGRFEDAQKLAAQASQGFRQQGMPSAAESVIRGVGVDLLVAGDLDDGKRLLHSSPIDPENFGDIVGLVDAGEGAEANTLLKTMETKYPQGTLLNLYWGPRIKAGLAMAAHKPQEAIKLMEVTRQFDRREYLAMPMFRADAYLAAGQPQLAEEEYREILAHPESDPVSPALKLSWLHLGRALAAEGNRSDALDAYQHFLTLWSHADSSAAVLRQARVELANLQHNETGTR